MLKYQTCRLQAKKPVHGVHSADALRRVATVPGCRKFSFAVLLARNISIGQGYCRIKSTEINDTPNWGFASGRFTLANRDYGRPCCCGRQPRPNITCLLMRGPQILGKSRLRMRIGAASLCSRVGGLPNSMCEKSQSDAIATGSPEGAQRRRYRWTK